MYKLPELSTYEWQRSVQSILSTPPISPNKGNRYLIGSNPIGVWSGKSDYIVEFGSDWEYTTPLRGMIVYIVSYDRLLQYITKWDELVSIGKEVITNENTGINLNTDQFGETITCDSSQDQIFYLPSVDVTHIGYWYRFAKLGSGTLTIQAADSDTIADSGQGGTIYNNKSQQEWSTLTLMLISETKWVITEGHGTWVTTI